MINVETPAGAAAALRHVINTHNEDFRRAKRDLDEYMESIRRLVRLLHKDGYTVSGFDIDHLEGRWPGIGRLIGDVKIFRNIEETL